MHVQITVRHLLFLAALLAAGSAGAATRYASPTGSGDCTTIPNACSPATCVSGMADNDTCILLNGTYTNPATMSTGRSCSARCYIQAETTGSVIINKTSGNAVSLSSGENNWTVQGLVVNNSGAGKGYVADSVTGLRLTDLSYFPAYNVVAGEGIYVTASTDVIVTNYTARHDTVCNNQASAPCQGAGGPDDCDFWNDGGSLINIGAGSADVIVQDSTMGYYRNTGRFSSTFNLTIRRNEFTNCVNHGCAEIDDVDGLLVENNTMNVDRSGACSDSYNGGDFIDTYCWANVTIRNNTLVAHGAGPNSFLYHFNATRSECNDRRCVGGSNPGVLCPNGSECTGGGVCTKVGPDVTADGGPQYANEKVYNNIIYNGGTAGNGTYPKNSPFVACQIMQQLNFDTSPASQYYQDYNVISGCGASGNSVGYADDALGLLDWAGWRAYDFDGITADAHSSNTAPTFVTYTDGGLFGTNDDLHLQASSSGVDAAINTGSYLCPTDDITGATRTGTCDIGAYQYPAAGGAAPSTLRGATLRGAVK